LAGMDTDAAASSSAGVESTAAAGVRAVRGDAAGVSASGATGDKPYTTAGPAAASAVGVQLVSCCGAAAASAVASAAGSSAWELLRRCRARACVRLPNTTPWF
jgi:hypothetical protein